LWIAALLKKETIAINGDGETSRVFCFVANVVQANLLAALCPREAANRVYNIAVGEQTTLNQLFQILREALSSQGVSLAEPGPSYRDFRPGDVRHSLADIAQAQRLLWYSPGYRIRQGIESSMSWYRQSLCKDWV
ncbi:MAG: NAD-dependent epimerase/dehydratase family protein, partial [Bryobacteraceae bacterium]